jgi:hypothetical protein
MNKESMVELQKIDCNCNDCKHMVRDFETFNKWKKWQLEQDKKDFDRKKAKAIEDAKKIMEEKSRNSMLSIANKMKYQAEKTSNINYGFCSKKNNKPITFLPCVCMIENQECFEHRRF